MAWHEHWHGPRPNGRDMVGHDHHGGDQPHYHLFGGPAPVSIPQEEFELLRQVAASAHMPGCDHSAVSYRRFGVGAGCLNLDRWPDGRWVVECHTPHRETWRALGVTAVEALRKFIAMHAPGVTAPADERPITTTVTTDD